MSSRQVRKLFGTTTLPPLEGTSDEEFEPLYVQEASSSKSAYDGLTISSNSEQEEEAANSLTEATVVDQKTKKKKKNKKKQRKCKLEPEARPNVDHEKLDEIDKLVLEVNAILGAPTAPQEVVYQELPNPAKVLLSVQAKNLNYKNEVHKVFGPVETDGIKPKKYKPHNVFKYKRAFIIDMPDNFQYYKIGFTMSLLRREDGISYFTFDHNRDYQRIHQLFLALANPEDGIFLDEAHKNVHVEALLECTDFLFRSDEYSAAIRTLEEIIAYLHYAAHPSFNLTDQSVRLEYKYLENRPFFVAILKYLYTLTNKSQHRTALELAKLLLNLDPSDPLALIYIIDVIALKAREHQWLVDVIDYWTKSRDANYLFNIKYSYALAHYHLIKKSKVNDYTFADNLLQEAILHFPLVATHLIQESKCDNSDTIKNHPLFSNAAFEDISRVPDKLKLAIEVYSKMAHWKWRETDVNEWFLRNCYDVMTKFDRDEDYQNMARETAMRRARMYINCPTEIQRHLFVIRSMTKLLFDWRMPRMPRARAWDPLPPINGLNRYSYGLTVADPNYYTVLFNLFSSVMPNFIPEQLRGAEFANALAQAHANALGEQDDHNPGDSPENALARNTRFLYHAIIEFMQREVPTDDPDELWG